MARPLTSPTRPAPPGRGTGRLWRAGGRDRGAGRRSIPRRFASTTATNSTTATSKANAKVAENLYRKATGDGREAVTAAIFWLKARARWKEVSVHEHGGPDGKPFEPITKIQRIIVSPPDREELRKLPGLAINDPSWPGNPLE